MKKTVFFLLTAIVILSVINTNLIHASEISNEQMIIARSSNFVDTISCNISSSGYYANSTFIMKCTGTISVYLEKYINNGWGCVNSNFVTFYDSSDVYANKDVSLSSGLYRLVIKITTSDDSYNLTSSNVYI